MNLDIVATDTFAIFAISVIVTLFNLLFLIILIKIQLHINQDSIALRKFYIKQIIMVK